MSPSYILNDDEVVLIEKKPTEKSPVVEKPANLVQHYNASHSYKPPSTAYSGHNSKSKPSGKIAAYIVGGGYAEEKMFRDHIGYDTTRAKTLADLFVFTGGEDINPKIYGETPHHSVSHWTDSRDAYEIDMYQGINKDTLKVGICRGGQLLNLMNGGKMVQHTDAHHGNHLIRLNNNSMLMTNSVHHQQMIPGPDAEVLACSNVSNLQYINGIWRHRDKKEIEPWSEAEIIWYPKTNSLCIQGHPEYPEAPKGFKELVWDYIETYYWEAYGNAFIHNRTFDSTVTKPSLS